MDNTPYYHKILNSNSKHMNKRLLLLALIGIVFSSISFAQTKEELRAQKAEKAAKVAELQGQIDGLKGEIAAINKELIIIPRWESGAFGTIGLNFNGFNNWVSREQPNIESSTIGVALNAYANNFGKKTFWRNAANVNMGWLKFDNKDDIEISEYEKSSDAINVTSLFGYKLSEKFAASILGEYRSTILSNFNNPGYLDLGLGATWTPAPNLVVVIHPFNQNIVFADEDLSYESSSGAKILADYTKELLPDMLTWKSNLSVFQSYKGSEFSNWTWVNSASISVAKGFGIGAELGLRKNQQEAMAAGFVDENPLQSYYVLGLSYNISAKK